MFENLKAFIRHGRQANDMKRVNPSNPPYTSATENPFGSGYQIIDGTNDFGNNSDESPSDLQYQQYQQSLNSNSNSNNQSQMLLMLMGVMHMVRLVETNLTSL